MNRMTWVAIVLLALAGSSPSEAAKLPPADRNVEFSYSLEVTDIPEDAETISIWVPIPSTDAFQQVDGLTITTSGKYTIVSEPKYGNRFVHVEIPNDGRRPVLETKFCVARVRRTTFSGVGHASISEDALKQYLLPSRFVNWDGAVGSEAKRIAGDATDDLHKARRIYDHIVGTVKYGKSGEGWGRGDAQYACDVRQGNCTDFHSLFIGEARSLGVPARFIIGFPLPTDARQGPVAGYHCWAEFYTPEYGWAPIDASDAYKHPEKRDFLFGGLDADRVRFTTGRDITLPGMAGQPVNFSVYPYIEIDGKTHESVETKFYYVNVE